jgi:chemotaxis receptor (MCP) glutamine deamidase CheD
MTRLPKEIYQDAQKAHKSGDLEGAMALYAQSTYFHDAAKVALELKKPEVARDFYMEAGDTWSAEQVGKKHQIEAPKYVDPKYVSGGVVPEYQGKGDLVSIVSQGEQGITHADSEKPILATFGIGPCISVSGYDKEKSVGFLTHYDSLVEVLESMQQVSDGMPTQELQFDVSIIGSDDSTVSMYKEIKSALEQLSQGSMKFNVTEEDVFGNVSRSVALDTRTGERFVYDPKKHDTSRINIPTIDGQKYVAQMAYNGTQ